MQRMAAYRLSAQLAIGNVMKIAMFIVLCSCLLGCTRPQARSRTLYPEPDPDPTLEQVAKVKPGMTKQKVIELLGDNFFMQDNRMCYHTKHDVNFTMSHSIILSNGIVAQVNSREYMDGPEPMDE